MTITILPEKVGEEGITYRAIAGARQSAGRTAGEALDALTKQMSEEETSILVIARRLGSPSTARMKPANSFEWS